MLPLVDEPVQHALDAIRVADVFEPLLTGLPARLDHEVPVPTSRSSKPWLEITVLTRSNGISSQGLLDGSWYGGPRNDGAGSPVSSDSKTSATDQAVCAGLVHKRHHAGGAPSGRSIRDQLEKFEGMLRRRRSPRTSSMPEASSSSSSF